MSYMSDSTGLAYKAGMWLKYMALELVWSTAERTTGGLESENTDCLVWRAPTWCWATVDTEGTLEVPRRANSKFELVGDIGDGSGPIRPMHYQLACALRDVSMTVHEATNGEIISAELCVTGRLREVKWQEHYDSNRLPTQ